MRKVLKSKKKAYTAPRVVKYGNARTLVKGSTPTVYDSSGGRTHANTNC